MHKAIVEALKDDVDEVQRNGALQLQNGWMHIHGKTFDIDTNSKMSEIPLRWEELVTWMI